jgi:hypothetical protein
MVSWLQTVSEFTISSEIFKELAWREERSRELILFKIDESESNSWNETKTYERTELVKKICKVCDFDESEVVFIRKYAEEENCEAIFRRSGSEFIILRIPNTENSTFFGQKKAVIGD